MDKDVMSVVCWRGVQSERGKPKEQEADLQLYTRTPLARRGGAEAEADEYCHHWDDELHVRGETETRPCAPG